MIVDKQFVEQYVTICIMEMLFNADKSTSHKCI